MPSWNSGSSKGTSKSKSVGRVGGADQANHLRRKLPPKGSRRNSSPKLPPKESVERAFFNDAFLLEYRGQSDALRPRLHLVQQFQVLVGLELIPTLSSK